MTVPNTSSNVDLEEFSHLSSKEYEAIIDVLKRDRELRSTEDTRIRQLRQEVAYLRRRGALRPGVDSNRSCARCLEVLGLVANRGAACPLCMKKVCKSCRKYGCDENHPWLCLLCHKQMQLKAVSGEWMNDFNRVSIRRRGKASPGDQLRRTLHETQRKSMMSEREEPPQPPPVAVPPVDSSPPPPKPPRTISHQPHATSMNEDLLRHSDSELSSPTSQNGHKARLEETIQHLSMEKPKPTSNIFEESPRPQPRVSPWSGIEAEPTIPVRSSRAASFGHLMSADYADPWVFRERYSSDDGHSTVSMRSQSTSSDATDVPETQGTPTLAKRRVTPLKKQDAVPEMTTAENQSSVDTTDSGIFSPGINLWDKNCALHSPLSAVDSDGLMVDAAKKSEGDFEKPPLRLLKSDASYSDTTTSESGSLKRVVYKKKKSSLHKESARRGSSGKLILQREYSVSADESGTSLRSSPHGRMRVRYRTLSGGSEDGRHMKADSLPQISVSGCAPSGSLSAASSEKDSLGYRHEEDTSYHSRSQMSISSFGVRSGSVTSVYSAAGGGRYGTVTVTGDVHFSLKYNYETSTMEVLIKECRNLAPVDTKRDRSDPYVKVYLLPDRTKSGKRKTKVKKHTLNPVFGELLKFHVTISELERRTLWLSVWHSDRFGRNDFLGEVMLCLSHDTFETSELTWYPLQERMETLDNPVSYKGDLILALKFVPPDVTSRRAIKKAGDQMKGSLHVLVKAARDLMANGTSDPFCKSYLLPDKSKSGKQKTPVLKKTCHPKWNHTFVYEDVTVEDLRERCLELTIWDYDIITSNDFLGGVRLCLGTGKCQGQDVDWMDSMGEEVSLWYTMLSQPNMWVDGSLQLRSSMQNRKMS